ncbi:nucleotidyltransferase family protein [Cupriavidus basilensis]
MGGKPLIVWKIEALVRAGLRDIVINHAWLGEQIESALGDGSRFGARIAYSAEGSALETAGGIAQALPLLSQAPERGEIFLAVSGDIFCEYDFRTLQSRAREMAGAQAPRMHLVMVPNPAFHPAGDFVLGSDGLLALDPAPGAERLTFGNIGLYDTRLFTDIAPGTKGRHDALLPRCHAAGTATGERFGGLWENVGTPAQLAALNDAGRRAQHRHRRRRLGPLCAAAGACAPAALES